MKKHLSTIILSIVLVLGVAIMLYPTASNYWNSFHQSRAIASYVESVATLDPAIYEQLWLEAREYNKTLLRRSNPFAVTEDEWPEYEALLNVAGNGIMGYIEIPTINVTLPIYHGTDESVLQIAVGHIQGSSLPVGGESTHTVLSGHRGLPSATLFTHLDRLGEGDVFMLRVLNETLTYEVDQIRRVLPGELDELTVMEGRDFCTLVTCTPYGVNTHRLLVRGKRIENIAGDTASVTADALRIEPVLVAPIAAIPMFIMLLVFLLSTPAGGKKKSRSKTIEFERIESEQSGKKKKSKRKKGKEKPLSEPPEVEAAPESAPNPPDVDGVGERQESE